MILFNQSHPYLKTKTKQNPKHLLRFSVFLQLLQQALIDSWVPHVLAACVTV